LKVLKEMPVVGATPNALSYAFIMDVCANAGQPHTVLELYFDLLDRGLSPCHIALNALFKAYRKLGKWQEVVNVMEKWPQLSNMSPNLTSYNIAIG